MKTNSSPALALVLAVVVYVALYSIATQMVPNLPLVGVALLLLPTAAGTLGILHLLYRLYGTAASDNPGTQAPQDWYLAESHFYVDGQPFSNGTSR